uniref:Aa_trans domain-containing protein n=1 Tax=Angiostrongylus cantonensis TaxID=6313 RepID=A0A158P7C7_ANGCA
MQCNRERANNWVFMKQLKERRYYSGQKKDGKKYGDEDRISAGHSKKIRKGYEGSKKSRRDENKRASPGRQGRKSEERLKGDKVDVERQSRESFSREKLDENRSSEGQNRKSYGREGHGRNRTSGEIVSGESYSREGYGRNRTSGEELSRDSYNREKSRDEKRHEKVNRGSQDNEGYYPILLQITIGKLSRHDFATTLRLGKLGFYCAMVSYVATMDNFSMFTFAVTRHGSIGVSAVLLLAVSILLGNDLIVIMVDAFFKSANAFTNQLPWDNCVGMNSRAHCQSVDRDCHNVKPSGVLPGMFQQRFYNLARFSDFYTLTVAKWPSSIFMAWIVIIFLGIAQLLATNRQAIIKSMSYICVSTIFLLTFMIVLVFVHFNPPKYPELAFLDAVNFKQEEELAMWIDAVVMACTILQLGYGGVIFLGMQNPFFNDLVT